MSKLKLAILFVPLALFIGLAAFLLRGLFSDPTELNSALIGKPVPAFQLPNIYHPEQRFDQSLLKGKPVLLNVWATWCPTCRAEHEFLNQLADQGVNIIGLNYKDDSRAKAVDWLNTLGDPYQQTLFDEKGSVAIDFGVYGAPETFIIDAQGIVRYRHVGDVNARNWQQTLAPIYYGLEAQ
ncbi:DsbE family thiol:disulfide interchange protein [Idiomarina xiamenensis]|uniref:Disulfide isomerase n=1 Tax=Idiomarina xiamenensis 10-D-4 TaxID=740709 RepID=K2KT43_9GAMM|nr:DsbE family thiol:disulfide interchange protein [Idiomarina xiamenensis]EKE80805.1 disulfide isomerase [Idiomarina xiamenensis 10-D-4]